MSTATALCRSRSIYIDLGVNWCNTLQLYQRVPVARERGGPWLVFGFEAAPLIVPHAQLCVDELSAGRSLPSSPVPPAGSSAELVYHVKHTSYLAHCRMLDLSAMKRCARHRSLVPGCLIVCLCTSLQNTLANRLQASLPIGPFFAASDHCDLIQH